MGKCFLYGNGDGGSNGLQFVSGSTEPANPSEGLIWVESSLAGKKYVVSISEPESPEEGLVWFNPVDYYSPAVCKVHTGSTWTTVNAYIFSSEAWNLLCWDNIVVPNAVPNAVVGKFRKTSSTGVEPYYYDAGYLRVTNTLDKKTYKASTSKPVKLSYTAVSTSSFDITNFNTVNVSATMSANIFKDFNANGKGFIDSSTGNRTEEYATHWLGVYLVDSSGTEELVEGAVITQYEYKKPDSTDIDASFNISKLSGLYSIEIRCRISVGAVTSTLTEDVISTIDFSKLWFE